jgi:hypothetical protein
MEVHVVNLRMATLVLVFGSIYTILHKAAFGLLPGLSHSHLAVIASSILWSLATLSLVLFAYSFLREVRPQGPLRLLLISIMVLTGLVVVSRFPSSSIAAGALPRRVFFGTSALLNSFALLGFVVALAKVLPKDSPLARPLQGLICALAMTVILGLVAAGYMSHYLLTGQPTEPLPFLQPLAMLVFLFTYALALWFLVRLRRLGSYADLVKQ